MSDERTALTREQAIEFAERWFDRKWGNLGQYQSLMETMVARLMALRPAEAALRAETAAPRKWCNKCGFQPCNCFKVTDLGGEFDE